MDKNNDITETKLLNYPQAAKKLSVSRSKIYSMVKKGQIPHVNIAGCIRFPENRIEEFLCSCFFDKIQ